MSNKDSSPLVSVVICNYNYEKYIIEAINSVLIQTYKNIEIIVVDDGSTDQSVAKIKSLQNPNVKLICQENGGQAAAFNTGFAHAKGELISFLDSDDKFKAHKIQTVVNCFSENDGLSLVQHRLEVIDANSDLTGDTFPIISTINHDILNLYFEKNHTGLFSATSGITIKANLLNKIFPLNEKDWTICADVALTRPIPIYGHTKTLGEFLGNYRIHGNNNWMKTQNQKRWRENNAKANEYTNSFLLKENLIMRVGIPFPIQIVRKNSYKSIALYGAGKHTEMLLKICQLPKDVNISCILDDYSKLNSIAGIPVFNQLNEKTPNFDAIFISSDSIEQELYNKIKEVLSVPIHTIYSTREALKKYGSDYSSLIHCLRRDGIQKIALYGNGIYTLNMLQADILPSDIKITCIIDESPIIKQHFNIPVISPEDKIPESDAVVISCPNSYQKFYKKAVNFKIKRIYKRNGDITPSSSSIISHRDKQWVQFLICDRIHNSLSSSKSTAIYGAGKCTSWLIKLIKKYKLKLSIEKILDDSPGNTQSIEGVPVERLTEKSLQNLDSVILGSDYFQSQMKSNLKSIGNETLKVIDLFQNLPCSKPTEILSPINSQIKPYYTSPTDDLIKFKNKHINERCFIMGNGPSLNKMDLSLLESETVFGLNSCHLLFDRIKWRPKYWVCIDTRVLPDRASDFIKMHEENPNIKMFMPSVLMNHPLPEIKHYTSDIIPPEKNRYYFTEKPWVPPLPTGAFSTNMAYHIVSAYTVSISAIQIAVYMGFKEIYLIGCDTNYQIGKSVKSSGPKVTSSRPGSQNASTTNMHLKGTEDDDNNHFDPSYFGRGREYHAPNVEKMIWHYEQVKAATELIDVKVSNSTVGGKLEVFPRTSFESLFRSR